MRRIAFIVAFLGILVLVILMWVIPGNQRYGLEGLVRNERVIIIGEIEEERMVNGGVIWVIGGFEVFCSGCESLIGEVRIEGYYDDYWGNIQALRVSILD